jgi:two-component system chemotaxis response regulator CheB
MQVLPFSALEFLLEISATSCISASRYAVAKRKSKNKITAPGRSPETDSSIQQLQTRDIIVIGGSAGCLAPLKALVSTLPADLPMAIFITVHVSPESPSILPAILTHAGEIPAVHPLNKQPIMKSTIYVAPPDQHLLIEGSRVLTSRGPRENLHRPAIDPLFRSAARAYGPRVIGIILSGLLDDGASGLMAIKMKGGLAVVQDPAEAAFPDMPEHALEYAHAEYVLPVARMQQLILSSANGYKLKSQESHGGSRLQTSSQRALTVEARNPDLKNAPMKEHVRTPSVYACPDCQGVLWEIKEGNLVHYRCRVGHSYTTDTLNVALSKATEDTLWASMRALEEKADLLRRMASSSNRRAALRFQAEAETVESHATQIRNILAEESNHLVATGEE